MEKLFLTVLNMSFTACFIITVIIIARLFLKKTPKVISGILWLAAGFRLVFPFSIESALSLIPVKSQPIPQDIATQAVPQIDTGISAIDDVISNILPTASGENILPIASHSSVNFLQIALTTGAVIWLVGVAVMLIYSFVSVVVLKHRLKSAAVLGENIYEANIKTPFVTGFLKPRVYIPATLPDSERDYIILHERTHIKRHHNIIKLIAYFILSIHWFNPLVWVAFMLMSTDMEMSCDESVMKETNGKIKKAYSMSILSLATERQTINIYPLAFGEGDTKRRIKNVLNYKKQSKIKILVSLILATVLAVGFMFNTASADALEENNDFELAADFLANTELIQVISQSDIDTGEENITRKDIAHIVARICNPGADTTNRQEGWAGHAGLKFYGTKMDDKGDYEMVYNETLDGYERVFIPALVMDLENKLYDNSVSYCIENGIMTSDWFSDLNATVTFQDAVKMFVNALKYDGIADSEYIKKASAPEVRLLGSSAVFPFKGVSANTVVTKNDVIMLAYNFIMSEYVVDVEGTVEVLKPTGAVTPNGTPLDFRVASQPTTYRSVLQTFGADVAKPISSKVTVDGKEIAFDVYTINGNNYFKLLDIAYVLDGTPKQFSITLHSPLYEYGAHGGTHLVLGTPFSYNTQRLRLLGEPLITNGIITADDYEMSEKGTNVVTAYDREPHRFTVAQYNPNIHPDDNPQALFGVDAYAINGAYYYKLRDLAEALDFSVEYDETSDTILIDTNKPYPNRTPLLEDVNAYLK